MWNQTISSRRWPELKAIIVTALILLGARVLSGIIFEYRLYFPANFEAAFLIGREESFTPVYAAAFYTHILSGPPAILLAAFLIGSGGRARLRLWHRWAGRALGLLIFAALLPSGLVMATQALAGFIAGAGFAALAIATAVCAAAAIASARARRFAPHQRWAGRTFMLLVSPLLLRVISGVLIVTGADSETAYCLNAWLSWLVPLMIYEAWCCRVSRATNS